MSMSAYFIRHKNRAEFGSEAVARFWGEARVGIHFDNIPSVDPNDYGTAAARKAVQCLKSLAAEGGYVCAFFDGKDGCLVGIVEPNSSLQIVKLQLANESHENLFYKTLQLNSARTITTMVASRLKLLSPRGTISKWHAVGDRIAQCVRHGSIYINQLADLLPFEQELMCSEFLRLPSASSWGLPQLTCMATKVGRTQEAVDIVGIDVNGRWLFAQVTFHPMDDLKTRAKAKVLQDEFGGEAGSLMLFCGFHGPVCTQSGVTYVPLSAVFNEMSKLPDWRKSVGMLNTLG